MKNRRYLRPWLPLVLLFVLLCSMVSPAPSLAKSEVLALSQENTAASAPWLDAQQSSGIVYLLYVSPPSIKRYQTGEETWLPDIPLSGTPTAFRMTSDAIYVGFGRRAARLQLDGSDETHLFNTVWDIVSLHVFDSILIANCSSSLYANLISFNVASLSMVDSKSYYPHSMIGTSLAPGIRKLFGRDYGLSPADIVRVTFSPEGLITGQADSPYHGGFPSASKTWVSPDELVVIDDAGIVYNTIDLTYRNSLGGRLDDLAYYGDLPIVLRNGELIAYSNTYLETGRATPVNTPLCIFISGETIYGFYSGIQGPQIVKTPIGDLHTQIPGTPVDPNGLNYTPDKIEIGTDEVVYLLSKTYQSIFRWSLAQRRYMTTIPLLNVPYTFTYSASQNTLYTVYSNGNIFQIELNGDLLEKPFANLPSYPCGLASAGSFVFTCDDSGAWVTHTIFGTDGQILSSKDWNYFSREYIWNAARQKMYFFRDDTSPNDILWEDIDSNGILGAEKDSPYHGDFSFIHPIRVKDDGSIVLTGAGLMFDGLTLSLVNTLSNSIFDAGWRGDTLVTLRSFNGASELQQWTSGNYGIVRTKPVIGSPLRLFPVLEGWLVITSSSNRPRFALLSPDLLPVADPPVANFSATPLVGDIPLEVHFTNLSSEGLYDASLWDFGDGDNSTDQNPFHYYTESGSYTIKLIVSGPGGTDTMIKTLGIQVRPVTAKFTASVTKGQAPLVVQFTNQATGQYSSSIWDFGDGFTSDEQNPSHTYNDLGSYTVTLSVDGPYGSSTLTEQDMIQVIYISTQYLPVISFTRVDPLLLP